VQLPDPPLSPDTATSPAGETLSALARAAQEIVETNARAEFMASASSALASSLDYEQTLATVARLAVPKLGDWCLVDIADESAHLRRLAVTHVDPEKIALARELEQRYPEKPDLEFGAKHTFRTGMPTMVSEVTDAILQAAACDEEHLRMLRELGLTSFLCVPLLANGRSIGVISLVSADPARRYSERDLAFAQELAARSALAIENARLYRESREAAEWLSTTLRSIGDAVAVTDERGAVKFLNPVAESLTGWAAAEAVGKSLSEIFQIVSGITGEPTESPVEKALASGKVVGLADQTELLARDGRRIAIDDSAAPIFDLQGKISGVVLVFRDVSAQRQAERDRTERAALAAFSAAVHHALSEADSMETMLRRCTELLVEHLGAALARIWLLDSGDNTLVLRASSGLYTHLDGEHGRIPVGSFKIGMIAQARQPHLTNEVVGDSHVPQQEWARAQGLVSFAGYPLLVDDELVGVIGMFARKALSETTVDALQTVSQALAVGIQRKQAQEALREQSEWFRVTLGSIGDAVVTVDTNARITYLNPIAEALTGWTSHDASGKPLGEVLRLVNETTREHAVNPIDRALAEGLIVGLANHTTLLARDGREIPIEDSAAPIRSPAGEIMGAVMVFHDVSERRQKETALEKSEQRFRLLGEIVPQLIWTTDAKGNREYLNERWRDYTGVPNDEWSWERIAHPEDSALTMEAWMQAVQEGTPFETECRLRRHDGEYRWFVSRGVPLREPSGEIVRWYGSCTDIHQQKITAEALREEYTITEQLHEVATALATELDLSQVVQIITDAGTRITRAQFGAFFYNLLDERGESYMLYTLSGVPREAFDKFPMPRATHIFAPTFRGEGVIRANDIRKDPRFGKSAPHHGMPKGHLPVVSYLAVSVVSRSGEVIGGLFFGHEDEGVFTERDEKIIVGVAAQAAAAMDVARLYQREQQARALAEQASHAKDHFLAALSHELRTPLTPVLAILSSLQQEAGIPKELADDLETVRRNVELEARLIDDLLDLTRITRGKLELHCKEVKLSQLIEDAIETCQPDLRAKRLKLSKDLEGANQLISVDPARITQILWNLLKNSVKFTPDGGSITIRSRLSKDTDGESVVVDVQDTGIGIEPERLAHVFEAFEQGDRKITRQFGGLGLGLAISKAIADSHQGTLSATSEGSGLGATFSLRLPFTACETTIDLGESERVQSASPAPPPDHMAPAAHRSRRILLVEDHADTAAILIRLLRRMGHHVVHAGTIAGALTAAHQEMLTSGLDLVMSDLGLPDGSGLDLMRELSTSYGLQGIALSGFGMESDLEQSRAAGFSKHLIKPIDIVVLKQTIAELG
jgi:PAS domain S-box-containing protein